MTDIKDLIGLGKLPEIAWNNTETKYPDRLCIHELFEQQAAKTPLEVALIDGDKSYSYTEINEMTNRLARALRQRGVAEESIVGCFLARSSAIVICTLSILKAGGTYLLLDSTMPRQRLEYILSDAKPVIILTDTYLDYLADLGIHNTENVSKLTAESKTLESSNIKGKYSNLDVAYISYTSGSTGRPKGVMLTHKSTVNHACAFSKLFKLNKRDKVPLMAPIAFDMAIEEMIPPLISGCTLIVSKSSFASMKEFTQEINDKAYTILNIPAPLWQLWVDYLIKERVQIPGSLRVVITGSDKIHTKSLLAWKTLNGYQKVLWAAAYGTTETTVSSTFYTSAYNDDLTNEPYIPIGKPIANTFTYILDDDQKEVEIGVEGELYIGGDGLARGYLNQEEMTRKKFIADPFRDEQDARMYKTGDKARFLPDGNLLWLGRIDSQMKFNGLRIEPGEIETVLNKLSWVKSCVVVLHGSELHESLKHIVAYVSAFEEHIFSEKELYDIALKHLHHFMVPKRFIYMSSFPLNSNGKVDRKKLESVCECDLNNSQ